jgi:hypothetical protein
MMHYNLLNLRLVPTRESLGRVTGQQTGNIGNGRSENPADQQQDQKQRYHDYQLFFH